MRIFYAAHPSLNALAMPDNRLWHHNLFVPLVELGHDVTEFQYDDLTRTYQSLDPASPRQREFIDRNRPRLERELLRQIEAEHKKEPIDLFFSYFYSACARPETIRQIRGMGIKTVNWYCNAAHQFHLVEEIAPAYDYCLVPEKERLDDYRRIGANPIYSQEAANPNTYKPYPVPVEHDLVFIGAKYGDRPIFLRALYDAGIDLRVFGPGWATTNAAAGESIWRRRLRSAGSPAVWRDLIGKALPRGTSGNGDKDAPEVPAHVCGPAIVDAEDVVKMFSRAKISLGLSSCGDTHLTDNRILQVRLRDFEGPMSGAFYMVEYMAELEEFFEIGREIVCYDSPADLVDKARYYLAHDAEREAIRHAGHARALRDHTWHSRFQVAFAKMGLS